MGWTESAKLTVSETAEAAVMARDPPVEQDIFHLWAAPDVVGNQVTSRSR